MPLKSCCDWHASSKESSSQPTSAVVPPSAGTTHAAHLHACSARAKGSTAASASRLLRQGVHSLDAYSQYRLCLVGSCSRAAQQAGRRGRKGCICLLAVCCKHFLMADPKASHATPGQSPGAQRAGRTDRCNLFLLCRSKLKTWSLTNFRVKSGPWQHQATWSQQVKIRRPAGCHSHAAQQRALTNAASRAKR